MQWQSSKEEGEKEKRREEKRREGATMISPTIRFVSGLRLSKRVVYLHAVLKILS
jgi:hypothetical protein